MTAYRAPVEDWLLLLHDVLRVDALDLGWSRAERTRASKLLLARLWAERELPLVESLRARIANGGGALAALPDDEV